MASGSENLRPKVHAYLVAHSSPPDALLRDLIASPDPDAQAIKEFNEHALRDDRVDLVMLAVGDGLTMARAS
jgi:predicted O-methyltransferase YrrM